MKSLDAMKWRLGVVRNMLTQSRRGLAFGRAGLSRGLLPTEDGSETTELEAYVDAHETGRGIWKWQHYLPIYERHFAKFKGTDVHVVEIGIYSGGSLDMWREYFGPRCHVYGVDISPDCRSYEAEGIDIFIGDQADPSFWKRFVREVPRVDIVIDDGGHEAYQQIATLEALLPHMQPGGVYVCEDIVHEYNPFLDYLFGLSRGLHSYKPQGWKGGKGKGWPLTDEQQAIEAITLYPYVCVIERRQHRVDRLRTPRRGTEWAPPDFFKAARHVRR